MMPRMEQTQTLHILDACSRSRAAQARLGFELGYHCEVYADIAELLAMPPERGIVLVRDEADCEGVGAVLNALAAAGVWLPVVATAHTPVADDVVQAIRAGALDYLSLPLDAERIAQSVGRISEEAVAFGMARRRLVEARSRIAVLSPRERQVLDWLAEGRSNKMIARELDISPRTVEIHRANMMTKIGARHSAEAVRLRIEAGLDNGFALAG